MTDPADHLAARTAAAKLLAHTMTGDSWGIQDDLIEHGASLVEGWPLWWQAGQLLQTYLPDEVRAQMIDRLRLEIVNQRLCDEDDES